MKLPSMYKIYGMYQNLTEIIIVFNNIVEYKINKLLVVYFNILTMNNWELKYLGINPIYMWNTCTYKTLIRDIKDEINGEIYFYLRFWRLNNGKMSISSDKFIDFYIVLFKITVIFRNLQTESKIWKCK